MALHIDMIGIVVSDMAASLKFYRRLGLEIPEKEGEEKEFYIETTTPNGYRISFNEAKAMNAIVPSQPGGHGIELAFKCESREELDAKYAEMTGLGYKSCKEPWDAVWGQRYALLEDPDGNLISLFS